MAARRKVPTKEFLVLTSSERGEVIAQQMELIRTHFNSPEEWIQSCLNVLPKNEQEKLFVCYIFGTFMGAMATRKEFLN